MPGRMEPVDGGQPLRGPGRLRPHSRLARERAPRGARRLTDGGADLRLRLRRRPRPRQAAADGRDPARELADVAVVTSDNPRSEDPEAIIDEILAGIAGRPPRLVMVEPDRRRAIALAIERAAAGRHGRDRRQGPRTGPGVRGRAEGPVRRPGRGPRGARGADDRARRRADRRRGRGRNRRTPGPAPAAGPSGPSSTRARPRAATCSSASRGEQRRRRASSPRRRSRRAPGAWSSTPERAAGADRRRGRAGLGVRGRRPVAGAAVAGPRPGAASSAAHWSGSRARPGRPR